MAKYDVKVNGKDSMYCESFIIIGTSKLHAMKCGIEIARKCHSVKGELHATAKIVREESFTPGICV